MSREYIAEVKNLNEDFYEKLRPRLYRRIARELEAAERILDLGCGGCELVKFLSKKHGKEVMGVDISATDFPAESGAEQASLRKFDCIKRDARRLDFIESGTDDAVVSVYSLHEMARPQAVLREARRVLRPGGQILIIDFPRGSLAQKLWDEKYYALDDVEEMMRRAEFIDLECRLIERSQIIWCSGRKPLARKKSYQKFSRQC